MQKYLYIYLFLSLIISSCGIKVKTRALTSEDKFENQYFSFNAPNKNWYLLGKEYWHIGWDGKGMWMSIDNDALTNGHLEIELKSFPLEGTMLKKPRSIEAIYQEIREHPDRIKIRKEQGISLEEYEWQYFQGMACLGNVFSQSYGGDLYAASSKNYRLSCNYYHINEGKRTLWLTYRYYGASGTSRLQKDKNIQQSDLPVMSEAEAVLKKDVEEVLNSIVLKYVDWERMKNEGLIYDKPFKTISW